MAQIINISRILNLYHRINTIIYAYYDKLWNKYNYLSYRINRGIVVDGFLYSKHGKLLNYNFGDDINKLVIEKLSGKKVFFKKDIDSNIILLCIGSIIENYSSPKTIIWGSGAIYGDKPIQKPKKVYAVRGPLSRECLISQGIECPQIYGDPALLLPYLYKPHKKKTFKIGIIPHYVDYDLAHVKQFREQHPEILFIRFQNYHSWKHIIEQINSCEMIYSSSLHGLIVSDAYQIPNVRVRFSDAITGGDFKYKDYYAGVDRSYITPLDWTVKIRIDDTNSYIDSYEPICFNPKLLIGAFPYTITKKYRKIFGFDK